MCFRVAGVSKRLCSGYSILHNVFLHPSPKKAVSDTCRAQNSVSGGSCLGPDGTGLFCCIV